MGRNRRKKPLLEQIEITDIGSEGKALGRQDNKVVFVPYAAPGDIVDVQVNKKRKNYYEGYITKFREYSPNRIEPFCSHFGVCGGCKWQHIPYETQLQAKQQQVEDNLKRIGKIALPQINPIMGSDKTQYYRNKLEYTFSNRRWLTKEEIDQDIEHQDRDALGFHVPKMFDKVLNIDTCYLQADLSNQIRNEVNRFAQENNFTYFDIRNHHGLLRNLIIRNTSTGQWMVIVVFFEDDEATRNLLLNHLKSTFPAITSLNYIVNKKANDSIADQEVVNFCGEDHIMEMMEGLQFKIGPKSFYQTNSEQAYELYKVARKFADLSGEEIVYDLYTGTGTIANFVSGKAKKVIGIEYIEEAVEDARVNAELNNIKNTNFFSGDMKDLLTGDFFNEHGQPDVIITDPPRAGMHQDVVDVIKQCGTKKIVYISCNPATQARDLEMLDTMYSVKAIQPVDMFPHTHHIENVVLLEKNI